MLTIKESVAFVKPAVSGFDTVPALKGLRIIDGRVTAFNGTMALSAPIDLDLDAVPLASLFERALDACEGPPVLSLDNKANARLQITSGPFCVFVPCFDNDEFSLPAPIGREFPTGCPILPALRLLLPFVGTDQNRPFTRTIQFQGQAACASDGRVLVETWLDQVFPFKFALPDYAAKELLRIGEEPKGWRQDSHTVTAYYSGERWFRFQLFSEVRWMDCEDLFNRSKWDQMETTDSEFFETVGKLKPFVEGENKKVYVFPGKISSSEAPEMDGASFDFPAVTKGCFNFDYLMKIREIAKEVAWSNYPEPVTFYDPENNIRGALMGVRMAGVVEP